MSRVEGRVPHFKLLFVTFATLVRVLLNSASSTLNVRSQDVCSKCASKFFILNLLTQCESLFVPLNLRTQCASYFAKPMGTISSTVSLKRGTHFLLTVIKDIYHRS